MITSLETSLTDVAGLILDFLKQCHASDKKPLLVILGATASGKTALSLNIAKQFNGEIVSADSRQVYRHMNIGTDKIPLEKREGIPHYMIDVIDPDERFTVADFKQDAEEKTDDILRRGKLPILVGGTGLYINVLTENFALPRENLPLRADLMRQLEQFGSQALHKKLQKLDPVNAAKIHSNNAPYIVRALEILMTTGHPKNDRKNPPHYTCLKIGLTWPWELLAKRIGTRIDQQMEKGLVEETKGLLKMGYPKHLPSMRSLGYQEIIHALEGEMNLQDAKELLKKNTRNFAKRQITWFKRDPRIVWWNMAKLGGS